MDARQVKSMATSLALHTALMAPFAFVTFALPKPPETMVVSADENEMVEDKDFTAEFQDNPQDSVAANLTTVAKPGQMGFQGAARTDAAAEQTRERMEIARVFDNSVAKPLNHGELRGFTLDSPIDGVVGMTTGSGGDGQSVDRITYEIRRALERGKVLVCWVLDSTASMKERREKILQRFQKVYDELDKLGVAREKALLTGVMAFGKTNQLLTPEPTADMKALLATVKGMKNDDSGTENIFAAVREVCLKYRKYQTGQRRQLMIVVVTDEMGDDPQNLEDAADTCRRQKVPVYVLGPMAPFGRAKMNVDWKDEPTGEVFQVPVDRGPESAEIEHLKLPFWGQGERYDLFGSGFGPFHLTRLVRESGGLYFMDDFNLGVRFDPEDLSPYKPEYLATADYLRARAKHPMRVAVIEAAQRSANTRGEPQFVFPVANLAPALTEGQRGVAQTQAFVEDALRILRGAEKDREKETNRRWQANFDLVMGRLLAHKVRCAEYNFTLAQMKVNPQAPKSKDANAFMLVGDKAISFGVAAAPAKKSETNVKKADPKANVKAKEDADKALAYLNRVATDHAKTPWGEMAARELQTPLGFKWQDFRVPPPGRMDPNQPPTAADKEAAARAKRRDEAMKRIPKL